MGAPIDPALANSFEGCYQKKLCYETQKPPV